MEIINPSLRLLPADSSSLTASRSAALVGELFATRNLVEVVVRQVARSDSSTTHHRPNDQRGETWRVTLQAGDRQFSVLSNQKLTPGQALQLQRLENGQLQVMGSGGKAPAAPPPPVNPELTRRILDGLRERTTTQEPLVRMIRSMMTLLSLPGIGVAANAQANADANALPADLAAQLNKLMNRLPSAAQVQTSAGLQTAILESGLMLEAQLRSAAEQARTASMQTAARPDSGRDFKAALLELQKSLASLARTRLDGDAKPGQPASRDALERALLALGRPGSTATGASSTASPISSSVQAYLGKQLPFVFSVFPNRTGETSSMQAPGSPNTLDLTLSTLLRQTAAALARIEFQQLQSIARQQGLGSEPAGSNSLVLELPVRHGEEVHSFQLTIDDEERDRTPGDGTENTTRGWKFTLRFDFEPLGPMCAEVGLIEQSLSTRFWAERPSTSSMVRDQLQDLRARLEQFGLEVTELDCKTGMPPQPATRFEQRLVDIRT